jgi:hypothetical protein
MSANPKVVKYFIKNAPVGEVYDVLGDVKKITGEEGVNNPEVRNAVREHLEQHHCQIDLPEGNKAMVNFCERQEDQGDNACYYDRQRNLKFMFDPLDASTAVMCEDQVDENAPQLDEAWANYRTDIQKCMDEYVSRKFAPGKARCTVFFNAEGLL